MNYEIKQHADGYQLIMRGSVVGICTFSNILDAIAACRVANRFSRQVMEQCT